ncbi:unnamed protein product [Didymodactylos carnosus]|uniref:Uncharacterized protein n=1 Tax=Didymodactylos carnosus TaxID=1234261 RepID=A0A813XPK5_9BILA|nr:unnamed protein product [Didymodactylos carnosus]CAF0969869.1 unnamed protein product [Didymodactylos carnosus]CAF3655666.1 unnamed protein product [Didymodactylos carnosus]CAF3741333.1 unnamed protein product [Didymodactylos carnosus]
MNLRQPHPKRRHPLKRLQHNEYNSNQQTYGNSIPSILSFQFASPPIYNKVLDYSLPELFTDHSSDPLINPIRISNIKKHKTGVIIEQNSSRFVNHELIIRLNGCSEILRPKADVSTISTNQSEIAPSVSPPVTTITTTSSIGMKLAVKKLKSKRKKRKNRLKKLNEILNSISNQNSKSDQLNDLTIDHCSYSPNDQQLKNGLFSATTWNRSSLQHVNAENDFHYQNFLMSVEYNSNYTSFTNADTHSMNNYVNCDMNYQQPLQNHHSSLTYSPQMSMPYQQLQPYYYLPFF